MLRMRPLAAGRREEAVALRRGGRHRLLEQDVLAPVERGDADLLVQVVGHHDVGHVHVGARQQLPVVEVHRHVGEVAPRGAAVASLRQAMAARTAPGALRIAVAWWRPHSP